MAQVLVECPVICPVCRMESLTQLRVENVIDALEKSKPVVLNAECHDCSWTALPADLNRIRRHLARVMSFTGSAQPWMGGFDPARALSHSTVRLFARLRG